MKQRRLILIAVIAAALLGGPGLQTFIPSVGTAVAQEQEEEELQTKQRGKKKVQGQISKPGSEKMSKKKQGAVVEEKQKKSTKTKKKKRMPKTK